jgi:hypothetical protein
MMSRIVSMKLPTLHRPISPPTHKQGARARLDHVLDRLLEHLATLRRHGLEHRLHRLRAAFALARQLRHRCSDDDEWETGIGWRDRQVAGVDEAVGIDADRNPLQDDPGLSRRSARVWW